ncbi:hypothetical protein L1987_18651 [Smallanthus sonchifolius]|uniref:Uncharacterized protein n=1 Tax=Smallanthus sonchifolius TaxID=185202 RepID=A0ACB9J2I9_9ASTR|nr:hypothetical protein L1987_18651 [Smallanthus sonchifolius]
MPPLIIVCGKNFKVSLICMGSQVLVLFRVSEDSPRHLRLVGDLGQIVPMKYNPRDENSIKVVMAQEGNMKLEIMVLRK